MIREKDNKDSQQDANSVEPVTPTTSNATSGANQFLVNGGALFLISLLGYYYYITYLRMEAKVWNHPLEYIYVPYIKELNKMDSVITYMIPAVIILSVFIYLIKYRDTFTEKEHLVNGDPEQYNYHSCKLYYFNFTLIGISALIYAFFYYFWPKFVIILLPIFVFSIVLLILWMLYVIVKVDASSYKKLYKKEKILKLIIGYYILLFLFPAIMIAFMVLKDYSKPTLLTTSCEKIVMDTEKAACEEYGKLYLVSENRGIGIWRAFSEQNHNEVQLSEQYFHIEMKNTHVESKTYTHVESIANTQVESKTNNND